MVLLGACAGALAPAPPKVYRIGFLAGGTQASGAPLEEALRNALRDLGYVEGRNIGLEVRWSEGNTAQPALAADLVARKVDVIVVRGLAAALAAKEATSTIPIVLAGTSAPVENGVVASLAQPGGNITGAAGLGGTEIIAKRLQLLRETIPGASRVAILVDTLSAASMGAYQAAQPAAAALGIDLLPVQVRGPDDFADALATADRWHPDAVWVTGSALLSAQQARILDFAAISRLPVLQGADRSFVDNGGLMFYGEDVTSIFREGGCHLTSIVS